ncbi:hypothetical protein C8T65DRAFT_709898 [Cerioporus squamosus]|nr:hypothetical protein C8T65DRAFT_709898 [Cerioporus squamosus]
MTSAQTIDDRVAETQSGADEVRDFALRTSYAFPSADVLVPAPMAVSILGQLTLVATATDFKLVQPTEGFKHVRYPDSFRATIMQLVNSGCLALNHSFVNFDEINKRCAAVRPGVNNIVGLLIGHEDNTPRQNELALERHLPNQIASLSKTVQACLDKAKETDDVFGQLLELTMEIHESCTATQGDNEGRNREADVRKASWVQEQSAMESMKQISVETMQRAREDFTNTQEQFNEAANSMPGAWTIAGLELVDTAKSQNSLVHVLSLRLSNVIGQVKASFSRSSSCTGVRPEPAVDMTDVHDPGYQQASTLRKYAEMLDTMLSSGDDRRPDWDTIKSYENGGCIAVRVGFEQILKSIKPDHTCAGHATRHALDFAEKGIEFARKLGSMVPPGNQTEISLLTREVSAWRDEVIAFACKADLKLGTSHMSPKAFLPEPNYSSASGGSSAELLVRNAQYRLAVTQAQLNASKESSRAASDKLIEINGQLGEILAQIAGVDVQKQNWEEITAILLKAIEFLCELKKYLNNLVHFFDAVNNLVSVTLRETADQFIQIVKDATAIELEPVKDAKRLGGVSLDAWAREAIYNHALSSAKVSSVVENISDMYITLYDGTQMGRLVGSNNPEEIAAAGQELQSWAKEASDRIVQLVSERMNANELDIQNRMQELGASLGSILPRSSKMEEIIHRAEASQVREIAERIEIAVRQNPVLKRLFV